MANACVCAALGVLALSCTGIVYGDAEPGETAGMTGEQLFAQCAPCHGPTGEGTAMGYELRHPDRPHATWVVRNGRMGAPEFPTSVMLAFPASVLSDADLEKIFDYLASFPQPTTGQGLYLDYCGNCHAADAKRSDISTKQYDDAIEMVRKGEQAPFEWRGVYMPAFATTTLSDAEVRLITDYIATLGTP
jgi:mono/diheme cytochrome c family protein